MNSIDKTYEKIKLENLRLKAQIVELENSVSQKSDQSDKHAPDNRLILDTIIDGYILADANGVIRDVNQSYTNLIGYTKTELLTMNIRDIEATMPPEEIERRIQQMIQRRKDRFETRHMHKKGHLIDLETSISVITIDNTEYVAAFMRDMSKNKKVEKDIKDSEYLLRESQKVASLGSYRLDFNRGLWDSSDILDEIFGIGPEYKRDINGWLNLIHPDDREMMQSYFEENVLSKHEAFNKEYRIANEKNNQPYWVHGQGKLEFDSNGNLSKLIGTVQDITFRKLAEQKLINSELRLKKIVAATSAKEGKEFFDEMAKVLEETNDSTYSFIGECIENDRMKTVALSHKGKILDNFDYSLLGTPCQNVVNSGTCIYNSNVRTKFPEDKILVDMGIEAYVGTPILNKDKECLGILVLLFDHPLEETDFIVPTLELFAVSIGREILRLKTENALLESEQSLKESQSLAKLGNWSLNHKTNNLNLSDELYRIFQIDPEGPAFDNSRFFEYIHPEDKQRVKEAFDDHISNKKAYDIDHRILLDDGTVKYIHEYCYSEYDENGRALLTKGTTQDVSERKKTQEVMLRMNMAINSANEAIFMTDLEGIITSINSGFTKLYGYSEEEIVGKTTPRILKSGLYDDEHSKYLWNTLLNKSNLPASEYVNKRKDGSLVDIEGSADPILDTNGRLIGFLGIQRDISERKKAKQNLEKALNKATESDRLKSTFLATMSHELRTPLNAIIGFSDVIDKSLQIEEILQYVSIINISGNQLLNIVEDLFDITMIEAGQIRIQKKQENLHSILNYIYELVEVEKHKLSKENLEIRLTIPSEEENMIINTDPVKLRQILINLVKNALKYTQKGYINFGYSHDEKDGKKILKFFVEDTGIGIPIEDQEMIFDIFRQVDDSSTREIGGTGIGLSIAKKLTSLLGGEIWVESTHGKGSSFYFTLALEESDSNPDNKVLSETMTPGAIINKKRSVLIVEDVESNYKYLKLVLEKSGFETSWAENGEKAIDLCKMENNFCLVLMDINLPGISGYDATRKIKKILPDTPVIAQTANAIEGDREKSIEAGCDDYISKPVRKEELLAKIDPYLG